MSKKPPTKAEKAHMGKVAGLPCSNCEAPGPSKVHHIREGQGISQRASHYLTVALCQDCDQGQNGIHGDRALLRIYKHNELDLLAITIERVMAL